MVLIGIRRRPESGLDKEEPGSGLQSKKKRTLVFDRLFYECIYDTKLKKVLFRKVFSTLYLIFISKAEMLETILLNMSPFYRDY